ncbi:MAG: DinB family protein [Candidatus Nanopelagicaceae bacterium]
MSKEILDQYRADIDEVARFVSTFALSMDRKRADGGWTASQCLAHLADAEISLSLRMRMMLTTDDYNFTSWDEDLFAVIKEDREPKISVDTFNSLRVGNLEILESLDASMLSRTGIRQNGEKISIIDYVALMSRHVRAHLEQAVKAAQG